MQKSFAVSLVTCLLTSVTFGCAAEAQTFELDTQVARYAGDPIEIIVSGLAPQSEVELHARRVLKTHYTPGAPTQV